MAQRKGTPTKKQLLSPNLDGMGFSNDAIMRGLLKHNLITDKDLKMMMSKKKPSPKEMDKKVRTTKPSALANKGGLMKKKSKMMNKGGMKKSKMMNKGGMKKSKMMARGGMKKSKMMARGGMKKTKGYARGGAARRR
tara:strand:- start:272 stop:682 length:411 start_codon:yes stop_codon:yes gene_type:complete